MRALALICISFALVACNPTTVATGVADTIAAPPVTHANKTVLDEQLATAGELLYKGFRIAATTAITSGACHGDCATKVRAINNEAYTWLGQLRRAYKAANSDSYTEAYTHLIDLVAQGTSLLARS